MSTTRTERERLAWRRRDRERLESAAGRRRELVLLLASSIVTGTALGLAYFAQMARLGDIGKDIRDGRVLVLQENTTQERIARQLRVLDLAQDRQYAAERIRLALRMQGIRSHTGAITRITVSEKDIQGRGLVDLPRRLEEARRRAEAREAARRSAASWLQRLDHWVLEKLFGAKPLEVRVPLLSGPQFAAFKPAIAVREPASYRATLLTWAGLFFLGFYAAHLYWRMSGFAGDNLLLPAAHLLAGLGLALMVSLRDPVRDSMLFREFSQGVLGGCILMAFCSSFDYERLTRRYTYLPLAAAFLLALLLMFFGSGPGGSDAKVNLGFFQPAEAIRILLVFFLAGYFANHWDALREMRQQTGPLASLARLLHVARYDYTLPVLAAVAVSLSLFVALRDMGPALVVGVLFLGLYSVARNSFRLAAAGLLTVITALGAASAFGWPDTVSNRVEIWLSVWNNHVRGGDQVAHSLWSFATGGATGTGLGLGSPQSTPAGHTDLILSVLAEQLGFLGLLAVLGAFAFLCTRCLRIALRAPGVYSFFLVFGLMLITAVQLLLISGGVLGLAPLSGVVTPFLSYGRSSMIAMFALLGVVLAVSGRPARDQRNHFGKPALWLSTALGAGGIAVLAAAAWHQVVRADETLIRGALVVNADGVRRYEYNPRISAALRMIPRGDIYDRNHLPLATNDYAKVEESRSKYESLGVRIADTTSRLDRRHYPLGPPMFYVLGDTRTWLKRGARNTGFEETRSGRRLQGYDDGVTLEEEKDSATGQVVRRLKFDYRELIPLVRHRWESDHPQVKTLLEQPRDVRIPIDARLQMRASAILERNLRALKLERGAIVALDVATGDLLASVSYPWPSLSQISHFQSNHPGAVSEELILDRARYGLYPPGSSFKVVSAIAALRKNPALLEQRHECVRLPDGRVGNTVRGYGRPIRDDLLDRNPHGRLKLTDALVVSCNAYYAQLGLYEIGAAALLETAALFGIPGANPNTAAELGKLLPQASYGQGEVVASPLQMARVALSIATSGSLRLGRRTLEEEQDAMDPAQQILATELASRIGDAMRGVVTQGTGTALKLAPVPVAGKTGTAEVGGDRKSHAWFIGYTPHGGSSKIAFAVLVENGGYGGRVAAPIAAQLVEAARQLGLLELETR
jgi:cell division protein FtsW (lipid II flippase)